MVSSKVRPAVVVSVPHVSEDVFVVPLTSKTSSLLPGEFVLADWVDAGLNVATAVKRGIYTINRRLIVPNYALKNHLPCEIELPYSNTLVFGLSYFTGQGLHKIITRQVSKEFATIRSRYVLHLKGEKSYS